MFTVPGMFNIGITITGNIVYVSRGAGTMTGRVMVVGKAMLMATTRITARAGIAKRPARRRRTEDFCIIFAPMRFFALIFSLYILALSAVPCCVFCGQDDDAAIAAPAKANKDPKGDEDGCKNCSPFTLCGHCVGFTVTARFAKLEHLVSSRRIECGETTPCYFFSYSASCWQPPRVG